MSDPMARSSESVPPLFRSQFNSTSRAAGEAAARGYGSTVERILDFLSANGPACIWEVAQALDVTDNRISGRFSQLERDSAARANGNARTTSRSGWQSSGATRSGAGSYRGGGGMRGGGGRRR